MNPLHRLFNPKSIAVIGGSWAGNVIDQLLRSQFAGKIWWVHPERRQMDGVESFANLETLPEVPDAAFVGVNRELTISMVQSLSEMGAGGACCFASGFLESESEQAGGATLQDQLVRVADRMPVLGPNCYGFLNYLDNVTVWPDEHGGRLQETGVAILTQSSNIAISFSMQQRGLPIAAIVTTGNQAAVSMAAIADYFLDDPRITAIGLHVEGYKDIRGFEALAKKAKKLKKPVVIFKVGKSIQAQKATITHTASIAGSAAGANAFAQRLGFVCVENIGVFLETLKLLHTFGPLPGNQIASISCSGGEASIMADAALGHDLVYKPLSDVAEKRLRKVLGPLITISNPLDYHTFIWGDFEKMRDTYAAIASDGMDLTCFVFDLPRSDLCKPDAWFPAMDSLKAAVKQTGARVAVVPTMQENLPEPYVADLSAHGIATLFGIEDAHSAIEAAHRSYRLLHKPVAESLFVFDAQLGKLSKTEVLDENQSKSKLSAFGLQIPKSQVFDSAKELESANLNIGFPVALKGLGVAHKSEAGVVILNIADRSELIEKARELPESGCGILVEEMIEDSIAELIVGVTRDEAHGLLLTIGAGGIFTELLQDSVSLLLPTTFEEIKRSIGSLRISKLIDGYRGRPAGDLNRIVQQVFEISQFALTFGNELEELDINPLIVDRNNVHIADALIVRRRYIENE